MLLKERTNTSLSDKVLMTLYYQSHDQEIIGQLFNKYIHYVYATCKHYLHNREDAKDATMSIYLLVAEQMKKHEVKIFRNWLYVISKHFCFKFLKKQKTSVRRIEEGEEMEWQDFSDLESMFENKALLTLLNDCLKKLKQEQQSVVELFYLEQKTYFEIANMTGYDWNKVRSYVQNGKRNLKTCIEKNG